MHKSDTTLAQRKFEYSNHNLRIYFKNAVFPQAAADGLTHSLKIAAKFGRIPIPVF